MSIKITVNLLPEIRVFHAGDQVSGLVIVNGPLKIPDAKVEIEFTGSSETSREIENHEHADKAYFFRFRQTLYVGGVDVEDGASRSWPFTFLLPEVTEPEGGGS